MKKLIILSVFLISSLSFSFFSKIKSGIASEIEKIKSEIVLKEEEKPFFREIKVNVDGKAGTKKVIPGRYYINLFELNYPKTLVSKNSFYNRFSDVIKKISVNNKKYSFLLEKNFFEDMQNMKSGILSEEEKLLEIPASSLSPEQVSELMWITESLKLSDYLGTDQEYLNRQVYLLHELLGKKDYNGNNVYSELEKEFLITELKEKRKKIIESFEKSNFEYFVKEDYRAVGFDEFQDASVYKFDKDIVVSENIEDQAILPEMKQNVYLTGFPEKIVDNLEKNKVKLKRNLLLVENSKFHGYTYNENNIVVFVGGKYSSYYYNDYKIDVVRRKINIEDLLDINSNYYVSDFFN